jgi:hypothetical protein
MFHGDPERFRASQPGRSSTGWFARMSEARGRETTPAKRTEVIFGPKGDTNSFSNRGKQSLGTINQRQTSPAARIGPSISTSGPISGISRGSSQLRPAGESVQSPKTPSVTFGGYRGGNEARVQSLRGQSSRQGGMETRPSVQSRPTGKSMQSSGTPSAPASRGSAPEGKNSSGERHGR